MEGDSERKQSARIRDLEDAANVKAVIFSTAHDTLWDIKEKYHLDEEFVRECRHELQESLIESAKENLNELSAVATQAVNRMLEGRQLEKPGLARDFQQKLLEKMRIHLS